MAMCWEGSLWEMGGASSYCDPHQNHCPHHYPHPLAGDNASCVSCYAIDAPNAVNLEHELAGTQQALVGYELVHHLAIQLASDRKRSHPKTKTSVQLLSTICCTQLMDEGLTQ